MVLVNNHVVDTSMERIGGVRTSGEFGSMLKELFDPATRAQFEWERWATLRGQRMHVYSYSVAQERSKYSIQYEHLQPIVPAYTGLVYVDRDTLTIMRVTQEVTQVPAGFPITYVRNILDYDTVQISGQPFILPLKASTVSRMGKEMTKNDTEFRMYNKFGAEATITFEPEADTGRSVERAAREEVARLQPFSSTTITSNGFLPTFTSVCVAAPLKPTSPALWRGVSTFPSAFVTRKS